MKKVILILSLSLIVGCGVPTAQAPRENLEPVVLRSFAKQDWRFTNNKFFLWREDMTVDQVSRALSLSKELDALDTKAFPLNRRHLELELEVEPISDAIAWLVKLRKELAKPNPNAAEVNKFITKLMTLRERHAILKDQLAALSPDKELVQALMLKFQAMLAPRQAEKGSIEPLQTDIFSEGLKKVDEIMTVVDYYKDQPTAVVFQFQKDGSISASISGWNLSDDAGARNFSTETVEPRKPTMGSVTYEELGGVFNFEVYVFTDESQSKLRETYDLRISRIKYDIQDGRNFFGGEITRTRSLPNGQTETRRGLAKLVDRNN